MIQDYTAFCRFVFQDFWAWMAKEFPDVSRKSIRDCKAGMDLFREMNGAI